MPATKPKRKFIVDPKTAMPFSELRKQMPTQPCVKTVSEWATAGRRNIYTGERCYLPFLIDPSGTRVSTMDAYVWFVREINKRPRGKATVNRKYHQGRGCRLRVRPVKA